MEPLEATQTVRIHGKEDWREKGQVQREVAPYSYEVQLESGRSVRRNRGHLSKTKEPFVPTPDEETDIDPPTVQGTPKVVMPETKPSENKEPISSFSTRANTKSTSVGPVQTTRSGQVVKRPSQFE